MKNHFLIRVLWVLIIPLFLFSQNLKEEINEIIDEQLEKQILIAENIIKDINLEKYPSIDEEKYNKEISYLLNRIDINQRQNNSFAVKRDEIKLLFLQEKRAYEITIKNLIDARSRYKNKEFFETIIKDNIVLLEQNSIQGFSSVYEEELQKDNKVAKEFVKNYKDLEKQSTEQLFILRYLNENINLYKKTNFFIDKFNIQYFISTIDSIPSISAISKFTSHSLGISIGEVLVVIFIMLLFRILNTRIITLLSNFINKLFVKRNKKQSDEEQKSLEKYVKKSIERPLVLSLYLLSIHISIYILVKNIETINSVIPWINTTYMGLFTWAIYSLLSNSITNYAQHFVQKYPNVRKEMIIFILRILKIILILVVILFLFSQLGIDIKAIAASLGVGGIAIALASKDTLANFFGSLNIMTDNSFSQGDWIVVNDVEGTVVDIRMRTTRIRTFDNAMITVPNSELANTHIKNYSKRKIGRRIKMKIGITYESAMSDIVNLKNDIYEMLHSHPSIATEKNVTLNTTKKFEAIKREDLHGVKRTLLVYIDEYDNSSINILIYCFSRTTSWEQWLEVKEDVLVKVAKLVEDNNCEFAYPTQTLFVKK